MEILVRKPTGFLREETDWFPTHTFPLIIIIFKIRSKGVQPNDVRLMYPSPGWNPRLASLDSSF